MNRDELAKAIFDWLNRDWNDIDGGDPYTYNADEDALMIGVDGELNCKLMADGIIRALGLVRSETDPARQIKIKGTITS